VVPGSAHGTGVAEIVHEMAPDADLYLGSALTVGDYLAVLDYFAAQGVQVVTHNMTWAYDGPGDGTAPAFRHLPERHGGRSGTADHTD